MVVADDGRCWCRWARAPHAFWGHGREDIFEVPRHPWTGRGVPGPGGLVIEPRRRRGPRVDVAGRAVAVLAAASTTRSVLQYAPVFGGEVLAALAGDGGDGGRARRGCAPGWSSRWRAPTARRTLSLGVCVALRGRLWRLHRAAGSRRSRWSISSATVGWPCAARRRDDEPDGGAFVASRFSPFRASDWVVLDGDLLQAVVASCAARGAAVGAGPSGARRGVPRRADAGGGGDRRAGRGGRPGVGKAAPMREPTGASAWP